MINTTNVGIVLSVALALVLAVSAIPKLRYPKGFVVAVLAYDVLPPRLGRLYAWLLPPLELFNALLLASGTVVRAASVMTSLLLFSFIVAVGVNVARGRDLDCHCFGKSMRRGIGVSLLLQDGALLGVAITLAVVVRDWWGTEPWSVFRIGGLTDDQGASALITCMFLVTIAVALALPRVFTSSGQRCIGARA
ncbi:MAG TPA: MauE/DoxX family redox-associated membrane protein [Chloroflexota bacterium]|nr:MauE/DoxX family redox-associated membrane protein [Chloroflexota bacterium]